MNCINTDIIENKPNQHYYRLLSSPFQVEEEDDEKNKQFYDVCKNVNEKKQWSKYLDI